MGERTEVSTNWSVFRDRIRELWDGVRKGDLNEAQNSLEELVDQVQRVTGEKREQVQSKLEELADRFDRSFDS